MTDHHEPQGQHNPPRNPPDDVSATGHPNIAENENKKRNNWGRILCWLGTHDDKVIDATFGFGAGGNVERVECKRCGRLETRYC